MLEYTLPDGRTVESYPLTPAQQLMLYLSIQYGNHVPVLNICTGYYFQGEFDSKVMKEAVLEAIDRCDVMRLRFAKHPLFKVVQYLADEAGIEVEEEDLSNMPWDEAHEFIKERGHSLIDTFADAPLHQIKIIHLENDYNGIYLKLHHLGFDGYSSKMLISDIMAIYLSKKYGKPYPKPMRSYFECLDKEFAYAESDRHDEDIAYWVSTITDRPEAIYTDYVRPSRLIEQRIRENKPDLRIASVHDGDDPSSKTLRYSLSKETSDKIMSLCAEKGLSVPCVMMMGLRCALSSFNDNEEDVSFKLMVNRRATLLEKKSGGMRMHFFSMRSIVKPEMTFLEALKVIEQAQNEVFEHSNLSSLEAIAVRHKAMGNETHDVYESMSFSYQPYMPVPCLDEKMRDSSRGFWYNNDASIQNLYLTVMHRSNDAGLDFNYEYRTKNNPINELGIFHNKLIKSILLGTRNTGITVGEILDEIKEDEVDIYA